LLQKPQASATVAPYLPDIEIGTDLVVAYPGTPHPKAQLVAPGTIKRIINRAVQPEVTHPQEALPSDVSAVSRFSLNEGLSEDPEPNNLIVCNTAPSSFSDAKIRRKRRVSRPRSITPGPSRPTTPGLEPRRPMTPGAELGRKGPPGRLAPITRLLPSDGTMSYPGSPVQPRAGLLDAGLATLQRSTSAEW